MRTTTNSTNNTTTNNTTTDANTTTTDANITTTGTTATGATRTARRAVALLALHATGLVGAVGVPSSALAAEGPDTPDATARATLEAVCVAHGGSFHVNTYDGVNLICSAPRRLGDFAAARAACDRVEGDFSHTAVIEGRASWFCHDRAS